MTTYSFLKWQRQLRGGSINVKHENGLSNLHCRSEKPAIEIWVRGGFGGATQHLHVLKGHFHFHVGFRDSTRPTKSHAQCSGNTQ